MKRFSAVFIGGLMINVLALGQTEQTQTGNTANVPSPTPGTIISSDANSQVWEWTNYEQGPNGQIVTNQQQYTELATGLNYKDPTTGQWVPSQEVIDIMPDGSAAATNGQHQAYFPANIYNGTITLVTPDGLQLQSQPVGLFYDDGSNTVMIAALTNSVGELISSNQVIYPNAFTGVDADLLYTYTKAGFEQDVILNQQPPVPESYGIDPQAARLQLITEFFNPPQPSVSTTTLPEQSGLALPDSTLDFGTMEMIQGRAFLLGTNTEEAQVLVGKQWLSVDGRQFLVEEVPVAAMENQLSELPAMQTSSIKPSSPLNLVSAKRLLPPQRTAKVANGQVIHVTQAGLPRHGLLLDYQTINTSITNFTFQGDATYYLSGTVYLYNTNTFEGGAVLKYATNATLNFLGSTYTLMWEAARYRPVIFTAKDDNSVGQTISGSSGNPTNYYADPALSFSSYSPGTIISNFRIAYARQAISVASCNMTFYDGQIVDCANGLMSGPANSYLRNMLFANVQTNLNDLGYTLVDAQNVTFAGNTNNTAVLISELTTNCTLDFTNCVLANMSAFVSGPTGQLNAGYNGFYSDTDTNYGSSFGSSHFSSPASPFQSAGEGDYYLTNGCGFFDVGTTNLDPGLPPDLAVKTVYSPVTASGIILTNTIWPQAVARDNASVTFSNLALGYHYDPLDYIVTGSVVGLSVTNGATLTLSNGVAVGLMGEFGFQLSSTAGFLSHGGSGATNDPMNQIVWYPSVQEEPISYVSSRAESGIFYTPTPESPSFQASFTAFSMLGNQGPFFGSGTGPQYFSTLALTNCQLRNVNLSVNSQLENGSCSQPAIVTLKNNLWERSTISFFNGCVIYSPGGPPAFYQNPLALTVYDNTFWQCTNALTYDADAAGCYPAWNIADNLYDGGSASFSGNGSYSSYISASYDAYDITMPSVLTGTGDVSLTSLAYAAGPLGNRYNNTNNTSPTLVAAGNTNANVLGLYWFTTQTNQTINGANLVDIGYHYVATDTNGYPLENLGTNVPNYIAYPNGSPPEITSEPINQTVYEGSNAFFSVTAVGSSPLSYQWFWDGVPLSDEGGISDSASATLSLSGVNLSQTGYYYVVVTNSFNTVTSATARLAVLLSQTNTYETPIDIVPANAYWNVTDISDPAQPVKIGELQAPFSGTNYSINPSYITPWHTNTAILVTNAYGTAFYGGSNAMGTVFEIGLVSGLTVIYTFNGDDGAYPCSQLAISGSTFYGITNTVYGTTFGGGVNNYGTVFKVNTDGTGFTNLYNFTGENDGRNPQTGLLISGSTLYGTTTNSIFKINTDGSDFICLTNITNASQLILSLSGNILYGTTYSGGASNEGMLFDISVEGTNLIDLHDFTGSTNGVYPCSGLELFGISNSFYGSDTFTLYGTTSDGGSNGEGMVFSISSTGSGFTDLHDFNGTTDGANPVGGLLVTNNNFLVISNTYLFGTTITGGAYGGGTVFGMNLNGSGFHTLYSFGGTMTNGIKPDGKLAFLGPILYGTTSGGGAYSNGMAFSINNNGSGFNDLHDFNGTNDGGSPLAGLTLPVMDNLASIWSLDTAINVSTNCGYIIAVDDTYAMFVNGNFVGGYINTGDAEWPTSYSPLPDLQYGENDIRIIIAGNDDGHDYFAMVVTSTVPYIGVLLTNVLGYGTTFSGGNYNDGTVFAITTNGSEFPLHIFSGSDGKNPIGDLVLFSNTLYGVTQNGGTNSFGAIFSLSTNGLNYKVLHSFNYTISGARISEDGANPVVGLTLSGNTLYGTTSGGGTNYDGIVFSINTDGSGYTNLYNFGSVNNDGASPQSPLVLVSNTLYGTTTVDGLNNNGTIFRISINGSGYTNLYGFSSSPDGSTPEGKLAISGDTLYGTTYYGSTNVYMSDGVIFSFTVGSTTDEVLYSFGINSTDGINPVGGLTLSGNTLYGTTQYGGANRQGTIFSIGTNGIGYNILKSFGSSGYDGDQPKSDLMLVSNLLFGTTVGGGTNYDGILFSMNTNGTSFTDIHDFGSLAGDGGLPEGGLCSP